MRLLPHARLCWRPAAAAAAPRHTLAAPVRPPWTGGAVHRHCPSGYSLVAGVNGLARSCSAFFTYAFPYLRHGRLAAVAASAISRRERIVAGTSRRGLCGGCRQTACRRRWGRCPGARWRRLVEPVVIRQEIQQLLHAYHSGHSKARQAAPSQHERHDCGQHPRSLLGMSILAEVDDAGSLRGLHRQVGEEFALDRRL